MEFHEGVTLESFWQDWFGMIGREIGSDTPIPLEFGNPPNPSRRKYSDNPNNLIASIKWCEENKHSIWITAQPFRDYAEPIGIEKLFFDFDDDYKYCSKCKKWFKKDDGKHVQKGQEKGTSHLLCKKHQILLVTNPRKEVVARDVRRFLRNLLPTKIIPFVVETYKGYHVYLFLYKIFGFDMKNIEFVKQVYRYLLEIYAGPDDYKFLDNVVRQDVVRMARVPLTIHEDWGKRCRIVKLSGEELVEDKVRNVSFYRTYGIKESDIRLAIKAVEKDLTNKHQQEISKVTEAGQDLINQGTGFIREIRPCFKARMQVGEMNHAMRLAFLPEIYFNGYDSAEKMIELFKSFSDFNPSITTYQVDYFFKHGAGTYPPYKCDTLIKKGYCIENDCPLYRKKNL